MDMFYLGDCLRGLNLNPTLKMIDKLGGAKKKGEKFIKLEEVSPWHLGRLAIVFSLSISYKFRYLNIEIENSYSED